MCGRMGVQVIVSAGEFARACVCVCAGECVCVCVVYAQVRLSLFLIYPSFTYHFLFPQLRAVNQEISWSLPFNNGDIIII